MLYLNNVNNKSIQFQSFALASKQCMAEPASVPSPPSVPPNCPLSGLLLQGTLRNQLVGASVSPCPPLSLPTCQCGGTSASLSGSREASRG